MGVFVLYGHEEILKRSFQKLLVRIWNNFTKLFLVWLFSKIVPEILICRKTWPLWGWGVRFFALCGLLKFFKILLFWNYRSDFKIISQDCSLGDHFQKLFDLSKNMAAVWGGDFLHSMDLKKFFKILLLRNCWSEFGIISQDCSLGDPFQKLFAKFWSVYNMALVKGGFLRYMDMKKFLKSFRLQNRRSDLK